MAAVERLLTLTADDLRALQRLVRALTATAPIPERGYVEGLLADRATQLFVARRSEGKVVGCLTLSFAASLTGVRGHIDDVVVLEEHSGEGIGRELVTAALHACSERNGCVRWTLRRPCTGRRRGDSTSR